MEKNARWCSEKIATEIDFATCSLSASVFATYGAYRPLQWLPPDVRGGSLCRGGSPSPHGSKWQTGVKTLPSLVVGNKYLDWQTCRQTKSVVSYTLFAHHGSAYINVQWPYDTTLSSVDTVCLQPLAFILLTFDQLGLISLHMWETTVMHKQVSGCTVNFGPNFPESPFLESQTRKPPPPHFGKLQIWDDQSLLQNTPPPILGNFRFGMTKVYSGIPYPPPPISENFRFGMTKVYSGIPPPISENFRFGMTKAYSGIPPPFWKTSDLGWPKFTPEYPPPPRV